MTEVFRDEVADVVVEEAAASVVVVLKASSSVRVPLTSNAFRFRLES